jgi:hypothetical protein
MKEICVKTIGCKQLKITDNHDWESTSPSISVSNTLIILKYISSTSTGELITIVDENEYVSSITIEPETILSSWTKILDGYYQITIKYTLDDDSIITLYEQQFNKCNQDCKIDNLIADYVADDECDSCNKDKEKDILNIALKAELLCYAITCSNKSKVWELYNYINNLLLENNCKSC